MEDRIVSKVYYTDLHVEVGDSLLEKFKRLIIKAGIDKINFSGKYVAVKVHFGEVGNMAFLRQQYARVLCDHIKEKGGKPFLTDCNTLYVGYRNNALDHLDAAYMNGYNPLATGVHTIIADGLRGTDEREIYVEDAVYIEKAKIGAAIAEADVFISLTHFKGHVAAGFGGALKNIGMGCGSKKGKMEMHSSGTPRINEDRCVGCRMCMLHCNNNGVKVIGRKAHIIEENCVGCGYCIAYCPMGAIMTKWDEAKPIMNKKIAEYAKAVVYGKPCFHINIVTDVSPDCDCEGGNDVPVVPDIGMFASFDPVALDQACIDRVNSSPIISGSAADVEGKHEGHNDVFRLVHPDTDWEAGLEHAEFLGIGTRDYEIETVK